jgi:hypothetical protein
MEDTFHLEHLGTPLLGQGELRQHTAFAISRSTILPFISVQSRLLRYVLMSRIANLRTFTLGIGPT